VATVSCVLMPLTKVLTIAVCKWVNVWYFIHSYSLYHTRLVTDSHTHPHPCTEKCPRKPTQSERLHLCSHEHMKKRNRTNSQKGRAIHVIALACLHRFVPMPHTATHYHTLQRSAPQCNTLQHTATHCNTLQQTATNCNTRRRHDFHIKAYKSIIGRSKVEKFI